MVSSDFTSPQGALYVANLRRGFALQCFSLEFVVWLLLLDYTVHLRTIMAFLLELKEKVVKNATLIAPYPPYINSHLHNAVLACRAAQNSSSTPSSFTNKQHIPSHKKSEHQWRFTKTSKTS